MMIRAELWSQWKPTGFFRAQVSTCECLRVSFLLAFLWWIFSLLHIYTPPHTPLCYSSSPSPLAHSANILHTAGWHGWPSCHRDSRHLFVALHWSFSVSLYWIHPCFPSCQAVAPADLALANILKIMCLKISVCEVRESGVFSIGKSAHSCYMIAAQRRKHHTLWHVLHRVSENKESDQLW